VTVPPIFATVCVGRTRQTSRAETLTTVTSGWDNLGERVRTSRAVLGYSITQLSAVSGLSTSTLDSIENGRKTSYDPTTLAALERALGWRTGSVDRILKGLEAQPVEDQDLAAIIAAWPALSAGARRMLRILAVEGARAEP
jgi:transcriptional regulator with XRE-family HTH domain